MSDVLRSHSCAVLSLSEVGDTSSLGVLGDCLSVAATQHRPKDVLDKIDELWDEGREQSPAHWIRHAIKLVLNDTLQFLTQWQPIKRRFFLIFFGCVIVDFVFYKHLELLYAFLAFNPVHKLSRFFILSFFI